MLTRVAAVLVGPPVGAGIVGAFTCGWLTLAAVAVALSCADALVNGGRRG